MNATSYPTNDKDEEGNKAQKGMPEAIVDLGPLQELLNLPPETHSKG